MKKSSTCFKSYPLYFRCTYFIIMSLKNFFLLLLYCYCLLLLATLITITIVLGSPVHFTMWIKYQGRIWRYNGLPLPLPLKPIICWVVLYPHWTTVPPSPMVYALSSLPLLSEYPVWGHWTISTIIKTEGSRQLKEGNSDMRTKLCNIRPILVVVKRYVTKP